MKKSIINLQSKVLQTLAGKIDDFYLAGGTALSLYYFNHRESLDLDFFTQNFSNISVLKIVDLLSTALKKKICLIAEESRKNRIKMLVYTIDINRKETLKIDFIQDYLDVIKQPKLINGIKVLSLEDIYIRKLYALTGTFITKDSTGRSIAKGGRQEAKDFYDFYCLSHTFLRLSDFSSRFCNSLLRESIIRWFRTYNRMEMKTGLLELLPKKDVDYNEIERHFKKEVSKILGKEVEFL